MDERRSMVRAAGLIGGLTLLSRVGGYVRDVVLAYYFGASGQTDAFYVAFRIPNLLRRLFAEGSLTVAFIPVFTEVLRTGGRREAKVVADAVFTALVLVLSALTAVGIVFSPYVVKLFASGFDPRYFRLAVEMNRIMFPYILLVSVVALSMGVLNTLRHFFAPALSPLLLNLAVIASVVGLNRVLGVPIYAAAVGVVAGGVLQVAMQLPFLRRYGFLFSLRRAASHPAVRKIYLLMAPQLFGLGVYNINIVVSTQYASHLPAGTVSYLYYAERLIEFPLGVFAVSIATALLPSLAREAAAGRREAFVGGYVSALRLMLFVMVPALVGLAVLRVPICRVLYERGEFGATETLYAAQSLLGYAVGLWAVGGVRITAPTFYALKDTVTPVLAAAVSLVVNAALGYALAFHFDLKHLGLALASSASAAVQFAALLVVLDRRMGRIGARPVLDGAGRIAAAAAVMGVVLHHLSAAGGGVWAAGGGAAAAALLGLLAAGGLVYVACCRVFGVDEVRYVFSALLRRDR